MIEANAVSKYYGDVAALRDVSFKVRSGEVVGMLGTNGAGKTTLIRMLTGYFEPSAGQITIDGLDVESELEGVTNAQMTDGRAGFLTFELEGRSDPDLCRSISRLAWQQTWELGELRPVVRDLETVFRELATQYGHRDDAIDMQPRDTASTDSAQGVTL